MPADKSELDRELDKGELEELPPNVAPGWLGEKGADLRKVDTFEPTLNAGVVQESSPDTRWLLMLLLYLFVVTSPVAFWMLWREPTRSRRAKIVLTVGGLAIYAVVWLLVRP